MNLPIGIVLVVDDDPNVLKALGRLDIGPQFSLRLCATPAEAEKVIGKEEIEVALVDQHLGADAPTGLDLLARLRERDADCFRIIFTGAADLDFAVSAINQGLIDAFLVKPWTAEHLTSLLNQGCETSLLRRHNRQLARELAGRNAALEHLNQQLERMVEERTASLRETLDQLRQQQVELVRLETQATVSQIARGLAHELNNPLAAILGYSQRLKRRLGSDMDTVQRLEVILNEVERCRGLVEQLRNLATPLDESPRSCDPAATLDQAAARLQATGVGVPQIRVLGTLPQVLAGPRSLARVFEQMLDNARLAGAHHCVLSAEVTDNRVRLLITNDGATPDDETTRNATRPFFTTRADRGHRGLGLSMASALLREQEGAINLDHREDGLPGALCIISLPLSGAAPLIAQETQAHPETGQLLVVDDDPMITELLSDYLREDDINVLVMTNAEQAKIALTSQPIRAVIADYHLEHGSGIDVLRALIARQPGLAGHVAVFTGANDAATLDRIHKDTGYPVLAKPFRLEQVQKLAREIL
ncbi:MAG TPA: response regulator [Planctomycetota bacterium]|nr:response regulator [Planctomycetota bacterium]